MRKALALGALLLLLEASNARAMDCTMLSTPDAVHACLGGELRESDATINRLYTARMQQLDAAGQLALRDEQRQWIRNRTHICHLDARIADRKDWLNAILDDALKTVCVVGLTRTRIEALSAKPQAAAQEPSAPPASAAGRMGYSGRAYDGKPSTLHVKGKYYFEFTINPREVLAITPTVIVMGAGTPRTLVATMVNITPEAANLPPTRIGVAVDLGNCKVYFSQNGAWSNGAPGSNQGSDIKLGSPVAGAFVISARSDQQRLLDSGAFVPNFGDTPFAYALPAGYRPWRDQVLR